jgi:GTP-binding nuclear protein Ran
VNVLKTSLIMIYNQQEFCFKNSATSIGIYITFTMSLKYDQTFTVYLVGDSDVGKTTFLDRHITGEFTKTYQPTVGSPVRDLIFNTDHGSCLFRIHEINDKNALPDTSPDAYMIMFDGINYGVSAWWHSIRSHPGYTGQPMLLVGNKFDLKICSDLDDRARELVRVYRGQMEGIWFCSSKSNYNFERPFMAMMKRHFGEKSSFKAWPAIIM